MEQFVMAIPSYKRADKQGTLEYLAGMGMEKDRIYIFVQTEEDYLAYQKYTDRCHVIYRPADGVAKARNNILRYFKGQTDLFMLDDDVSYIGRLKGKEVKPIQDKSQFEATIARCFEQARKVAAPMWGVYPVNNAFFMQKSISTQVTVNTAVGFPRGQVLNFNETFEAKEDIELCARVLSKKQKILRFNFLSVNAKHRTNPGGCFDAWHSLAHVTTVARLSRMYPDILTASRKKPNEVRMVLKDKKIHLVKGKNGNAV